MTGNTATINATAAAYPEGPHQTENLLLVAEGLHVLSEETRRAITARNGDRLLALARQHLNGGAQGLAVNLGPGRDMARLTPWVTETLREALPDVPLFLSASGLAFPEVLRRHRPGLVINAVTADPAALPGALATAKECGVGLVVLLVRPGLTPAGSEDRLALAAEVVEQALRIDFPRCRLYLDPLLTLRPDPLAWRISRFLPDITPVAETISQLRQLDEGLRTIVALGNCASDSDSKGGGAMQIRMLDVLIKAGLNAVIVNGRNAALLKARREIARNERPDNGISRAA